MQKTRRRLSVPFLRQSTSMLGQLKQADRRRTYVHRRRICKMLIVGINWILSWVQITTGTGTYTCPMKEEADDFYFRFKGQWHSVSEYAPERLRAEILSHKQGKYEQRQSISQAEFEDICREVLSSHPNILDCWFEEPGIVHVAYPSHSGKTRNGATLYFGEKGYITYAGWKHNAGSNEGIFIGEEISRKIQCALYE